MPARTSEVAGERRTFDARPDRIDLRDRMFRPRLVDLQEVWPRPELVDRLYPKFSRMILNQESEGACTGFGLAAMINYLYFKRHYAETKRVPTAAVAEKFMVSPRMLYEMARLYDEWPGEDYEGSSCRGAMKGWHRHGVCREATWPFTPYGTKRPKKTWENEAAQVPLGAYYRIDKNSIVDVQSAIQEVGAVYASAMTHVRWNLKYAKPAHSKTALELPVITPDADKKGGHAFAIVGYLEDGFIIQNSWGPGWGAGGFAVLSYEDWVANGMDAWVAALGAPTRVGAGGQYLALEEMAPRQGGTGVALAGREPGDCCFSHPGVWGTGEAYAHSVVLGNQGRPQRRRIESGSAAEQIDNDLIAEIDDWLGRPGRQNAHVAVYAHGGLNSEGTAVKRVQVMAPYFKENGVFPVFVVWKTGVFESLAAMGGDLLDLALGDGRELVRTRGLREWASDVWDRTVEVALRPLGLGLWSEMKENAAAAATSGGGARLLADGLARLAEKHEHFRLHLIGHSAGSIWLGHFLSTLREIKGQQSGHANLAVDSCQLLAPACTVQFALDHFKPAIEEGFLPPRRLFTSALADPAERADTVAKLYRKSLLYFISRACEREHKTPVLGMQAVWDADLDKKDIFGSQFMAGVEEWRRTVASAPVPTPRFFELSEHVNPGDRCKGEPASHRGFDNDIEVISQALKRVLQAHGNLRVPVTCLGGP